MHSIIIDQIIYKVLTNKLTDKLIEKLRVNFMKSDPESDCFSRAESGSELFFVGWIRFVSTMGSGSTPPGSTSLIECTY